VFYVNRGQAISSFGIESKDKAILEFQPANKAYRLTSIQGFRTFLKVSGGKGQKCYEPFAHADLSSFKIKQRMIITSHDLTIEEVNASLGTKISVNYFTVPEEPYAALARRVSIENISKKDLSIECVDGLPAINPYGLKDWLGKHMSRTVEAWVAVRNTAKKAPFYQLKVEVADTPQVNPIEEGNFYFAFDTQSGRLLDTIVEAACVFGQASDFLVPEVFYRAGNFQVPALQQTANRTPSAMVHANMSLKPGSSKSFTALAGFAHDLAELNMVVRKTTRPGFVETKARRNRAVIDGIKGHCFTHSASRVFDQYCGQTFLDNVLRGGLPVSLQTADGPVSFNVYSRKHGDPERDYNFFTLAPTCLSQGNGNYRDVNQNRRNDVWFNQDVGDSAVINFLNLIQADGYNPLVVKGSAFTVHDEAGIDKVLKDFTPQGDIQQLKSMLKNGFMPGELLKLISRAVPIKGKPQEFLSRVLGISQKQEQADFGEGYWSDHWTYNLDLIESYLGLYPEDLRRLLVDKKAFHFHFSDAYVLPRNKRYVLTPAGVRQYHSLVEGGKQAQAKEKGYKLRGKAGQGDVYHTNLLVKLLCLLANKSATLDPSGIGIEMEANKPNWYDALNGLPGLLGSSINETFEVKRLALFVKSALARLNCDEGMAVDVFTELADFIEGLMHILSTEHSSHEYWKKSNDLKEHYRHLVRLGIEGHERKIPLAQIRKFLEGIVHKINEGTARGRGPQGLFASYYYHEVVKYDVLDKSHHGEHHVRPLEFKRHDLPYFLEGFVHALRVEDAKGAAQLHRLVQKSALYDKALKMYKVNADLSRETEEIGRARIFPPGWLENGSVWLHMEYKYLLELLRRGLPGEFFKEARSCFIPFLDPRRYGRSILENSSFIVSSAHEDKNLHGRGFVARLSGSTAEFIHMWLLMNAGLKPFGLNGQGQLTLTFKPILPVWLFTKALSDGFAADTYAFKFLNAVLVVYHNPKRRDTFGPGAVGPVKMTIKYAGDQKPVEITGGVLVGEAAEAVRGKKVERIDITLE
ncbi:MAG: hypothetical protein HY591_01610, partial [Candidatus Omnitrophica bacterium]|nr:hypothetical protein [Candidatus Omnitrophota bacterium]